MYTCCVCLCLVGYLAHSGLADITSGTLRFLAWMIIEIITIIGSSNGT